MGRAKVNMELISYDKSRMATYTKRRKGLRKKVVELATLCDVETCMIVYGPKQNGNPGELVTWPESREQLLSIIRRYEADSKEARRKGTQDMSAYFIERKKKIDKETAKERKKRFQLMYQTWDERINHFSDAQKEAALGLLDAKLEALQKKLEMAKQDSAMKDVALGIVGGSGSNFGSVPVPTDVSYTQPMLLLHKNTMEQEEPINLQPLSSLNPFGGYQWPSCYPSDQGIASLLPLDFNPMSDPTKVEAGQGGVYPSFATKMEAGQGGGYPSFDGMSSNELQYTSMANPMCYDPTLGIGILDNMTVNNHHPMFPPTYDCNPTIQPMSLNLQRPMMHPVLNQMQGPFQPHNCTQLVDSLQFMKNIVERF